LPGGGKLLYCIQSAETEADKSRATLFSLDRITLKQKVIKELGKDDLPRRTLARAFASAWHPTARPLSYTTVTDSTMDASGPHVRTLTREGSQRFDSEMSRKTADAEIRPKANGGVEWARTA
jgi:hypothetical protein